MARTAKLLDDKQLASVLVRLMMAVNDISVAYDAYEHWERTTGHKKVARREGGKLYYGRMMHSHVYEALQIIDEIEKSPALMAIVGKCSAKTQSSFDALAKFLKSSDYTLLCRIRNNTGFHYDDKLTMRMLEKLVRDFPRHRFPHSLGNAAIDWYFELGDLIIDNIWCEKSAGCRTKPTYELHLSQHWSGFIQCRSHSWTLPDISCGAV